MQYVDKYKDLKVGDSVSYSHIYVHDKLRISGKGPIIGFDYSGYGVCVWVARENGGAVAIPYEEIKKLSTSGQGVSQ